MKDPPPGHRTSGSSTAGAAAAPSRQEPLREHRLSRGVHAYICREILKSFALILASFEVVVLCIFGIGAVRDYGVDIAFVLPFFPPAIAASLNAAISVSLLFATALVYGRLIADREISAFKSFGHSHLELAFPPAFLGSVLGIAVLLLNWYVIPEMRFTRDNLGEIILARLRSLGEGWNRSFDLGRDRSHTLWIEHYDGSHLKGIFLGAQAVSQLGFRGVDRTDPKKKVSARSYPLFLFAEQGDVVGDAALGGKALFIELRGVSIYYDTEYGERDVRTDFKHRVDIGKIHIPVQIPEANKNKKELILPGLIRRIADLRRQWEESRARGDPAPVVAKAFDEYYWAVTEFHRRIAFAIFVLTFPLAGACLALFLNSPNRLLPIFVSLLTVPVVFYVLEMQGNSLARDGLAPWLSEQLGNVGLLVLSAACFLFLRKRTVWT